MDKADLLKMTKVNLDQLFLTPEKEEQLKFLIDTAIELIAREGVTLSEPYSNEEADLVIMYASYLYQKRATNEPMPRMLRWPLNNKLFGREKDDS